MAGTLVDEKDLGAEPKGSVSVSGAPAMPEEAPKASKGTSGILVDESMLGGGPQTAPAAFQPPPGGTAPSAGGPLGRQLGLTARAGAQGVTDLPLMLNDLALKYIQNPISELLGFGKSAPAAVVRDSALNKVLPQPETAGERIANVGARSMAGIVPINAASNVVANVATGAPKAIAQMMATNTAPQVAAAAGGPVTSETAREVLDVQNPYALMGLNLLGSYGAGSAAQRLGNVIPSKVAGVNTYNTPGQSYANPDVGQQVQTARKQGVNLSAADVAPDTIAGKVVSGARMFGGNAESKAQDTAKQVMGTIEKDIESVRPSGVAPGQSVDAALATDLRNQYKAAKEGVKPLFSRAEKLAGDAPIPTPMTATTAADARSVFPKVNEQLNPQDAQITKLLDRVAKQTSTNDLDYKELRKLQSDVFAQKDRVWKGVAGGRYTETQASALSKVYDSIGQDVDNWAKPRTMPDGRPVYTPAGAAHVTAINKFKETVAPFRDDKTIYNAVTSRGARTEGGVDLGSQKLSERIFGAGNETTRLATQLASDEGKKALGFKVLENARKQGMNEDQAQLFSTQGFVKSMNLGRADTPTPQSIALNANPQVAAVAKDTRGLVESARIPLSMTSKVPSTTGKFSNPLIASGVEAAAGGTLASLLGFTPAAGIAAGAALSPVAARGLNLLMSSQKGTDFLLGQGYQPGAGLLAPQVPTIEEAINSKQKKKKK